MFLYYGRRLHREFVTTDTKPLRGYWEWDFGDHIRVPGYKLKYGVLNGSAGRYPYADLEMREVRGRREAFREIGVFMEANRLETDNTSVLKGRDGCTYISLWEGSSSDTVISACFVLAEGRRKSGVYTFGYDRLPDRYLTPVYLTDSAGTPEPDSCFRTYAEAGRGGNGQCP